MANLSTYLKKAKSAYHVTSYVAARLLEAGFEELDFKKPFNLEKGKAYFVSPYPTSLFAFRIPNNIIDGKMHIACAHTDSPCFKIKPCAQLDDKCNTLRVNTEPYGGMLKKTWFDRPLGLAGAIVLKSDNPYQPDTLYFDSGKPWFIIPSLAPHMDREIEEKKIDPQKEMMPLYATCGDGDKSITTMICRRAGVSEDDILDYDLNLYCTENPEIIGPELDYILASRIDNVVSVAALVEGIIGSDRTTSDPFDGVVLKTLENCTEGEADISMVALFDNEEVGSRTKQGADSGMLKWIIDRIFDTEIFSGISEDIAIAGSKMLSVDGAHAVHPNYADKADDTARAYIGKGVVVKTSASQRYVTDSTMIGIVSALCKENNIPFQKQANKSGTPGGQTLGPIESSYLPIPAADIGVPMLGMHSISETMSLEDYESLLKLSAIWLNGKKAEKEE